ncbi:MAG: conjugal transfer protein TraD [Litorimonas sp.]
MRLKTVNAEERRKDARDKILLGGLLVKAGLREEDKAVLYGAILDMREKLKNSRIRETYRKAGGDAFTPAPKAKSRKRSKS